MKSLNSNSSIAIKTSLDEIVERLLFIQKSFALKESVVSNVPEGNVYTHQAVAYKIHILAAFVMANFASF